MYYNWRKSNKYYNVQLQTNLFNTTSVICTWGCINSNNRGHKIIFCDNEEEIANILNAVKKRRATRGYRMILPECVEEKYKDHLKQ